MFYGCQPPTYVCLILPEFRVAEIQLRVRRERVFSGSSLSKLRIETAELFIEEVPERTERLRKSPNWKARAIRNLAKAGLQDDVKDKKTYQRIANRARLLMTHVPENRWAEIEWFEEE
jgi:hypothetical protein